MAKVRAFITCGRLSVSSAQSSRRESSITALPGADRARAGLVPGRGSQAPWATFSGRLARPHRPRSIVSAPPRNRPGCRHTRWRRVDPGVSHVDPAPGRPALTARAQPQLVTGHGLHRWSARLVLGAKPSAPDPGDEDQDAVGLGLELDLEGGEDHALDLAPVEQLLQPGDQQLLRRRTLDPDLVGG